MSLLGNLVFFIFGGFAIFVGYVVKGDSLELVMIKFCVARVIAT